MFMPFSTFLILAHQGCPGKEAIEQVFLYLMNLYSVFTAVVLLQERKTGDSCVICLRLQVCNVKTRR